jgi:hypothetical protein
MAKDKAVSLEVASVEEAAGVLEYFNGFHDGFLKRITLRSRDQMGPDRGQSCTGVFDVEIEFSHYNYQKGAEPLQRYDQIIRASFRNVQDIFCDLREGFQGNTITRLTIHAASRRTGGGTAVGQCLALRRGRQFYYEEYRRWEFRESQFFTFTDATFTELPLGLPE